ncbi:HD domain-containing protein [Deinococcus pimensis]|uniref:HD domain-containing protein n=1 Tax=Deinococcus pimensis TaxID=309888 RepID=UPI00047F2641|nr:hypothetical protein [Deinococcus pimensis]
MTTDPTSRARERWAHLAARLNVPPDFDLVLDDLLVRHAQPWRAYHTLSHVLDVLRVLDGLDVSDREAAELAAWFHDAVYDPRRADNEARSAQLARRSLASILPEAHVERVVSLVLATATHECGGDEDAAAFVDADLAVLGAPRPRYARYANAIRREYAWVPEEAYREGRARVLRGFLGRARLYVTPGMRSACEVTARANLTWELARLEDKGV